MRYVDFSLRMTAFGRRSCFRSVKAMNTPMANVRAVATPPAFHRMEPAGAERHGREARRVSLLVQTNQTPYKPRAVECLCQTPRPLNILFVTVSSQFFLPKWWVLVAASAL